MCLKVDHCNMFPHSTEEKHGMNLFSLLFTSWCFILERVKLHFNYMYYYHYQLPAGGVGGAEGDTSSLHLRQHEELQLQSSSAGQQQRLWTVPAAVRRELPAGNNTLAAGFTRRVLECSEIFCFRVFTCWITKT